MNSSQRRLVTGLPKEGSRVRLTGLKNRSLNARTGTIIRYSRDGERVMVSLDDGGPGSSSLIKVKPKQIELAQSAKMMRRSMNGSSQRNLNRSTQSNMSRQMSGRSDMFEDNASGAEEEIMETLHSADAMFDLADTSGDGLISQKEFEQYMMEHTDHDMDTIRECFYLIDVDGNGDVNRDEVRNAFLKKRRELRQGEMSESKRNLATSLEDQILAASKDADEFFDKVDRDGSGTVTIHEFEVYMKRNTHHSDRAIQELFDSMDVDKDGYITREEVRKAYIKLKKGDGGKKLTLGDILGLDDDELAELEDDVYNMFFLADYFSGPFWFAFLVFGLKIGLITIIAVDLYTVGYFPDSSDVSSNVKAAQFLLLPVNVSVQEELITTFFIYANLKWSKQILECNAGATRGKFHLANFMRFVDGLAFLFINTTLLLQATQVLSAFLNFAALQFLSSIDNVALHLARDGYLSESLEDIAGDVLLMKIARNHNERLQKLDTVMLTSE